MSFVNFAEDRDPFQTVPLDSANDIDWVQKQQQLQRVVVPSVQSVKGTPALAVPFPGFAQTVRRRTEGEATPFHKGIHSHVLRLDDARVCYTYCEIFSIPEDETDADFNCNVYSQVRDEWKK